MKHSLSAFLLLGLVPAGLAQLGGRENGLLERDRAKVTYVAPTAHHGPDTTEILGTNLELIDTARVNGQLVPILANDGERIVIRAGDQVPGFGVLELSQVGRTLTERIEFVPSLAARWNGNQSIQLRLHPGGQGWYFIYYSFRTRPQPLPVGGVHYGELLDMTIPYSGELFGGMVQGHEPMLFPPIPVPRNLAQWGAWGSLRPMSVQALCMSGPTLCFSNMVTLQPTL